MRETSGHIQSAKQAERFLAELLVVDAAHVTMITPEQVGCLVVEGVRNNEPYIITHPGSAPAVRERNAEIEQAYWNQAKRHPDLP
jgi:hypothetical protein